MMPAYPNGVTREMMEAGTEVLLRAKYVGVAFASGSDKPLVMETPSAIACALARAYPAMADKAEGGSRDTLLHPGPIGGDRRIAGCPHGKQRFGDPGHLARVVRGYGLPDRDGCGRDGDASKG